MLFVSWSFAVFLPVVFALHYLGRGLGWQVGVLSIASFIFYGWANPKLIPLLAISALINSAASQVLLSPKTQSGNRRRTLILALVFNVGALAFFKYAGLFGRFLLPAALWDRWGSWLSTIPLPVGISFFTFQGVSLVVDAWHAGAKGIPGLPPPVGPEEIRRHYGKVTFFKAFFPQLIAGPIVKAGQFFYQITPKRLGDIDWDGAVKYLILGAFLKMVVADNLKEVTAWMQYPTFLSLPRLNLLALLYAFSFEILADFGGYSIIALGLAKLFGYELPTNFNYPYISRSITEFWRRWHMTLSSWLREYLYIPLGGNRRGDLVTYRNLIVVMFLGGLWHGAGWRYAIWGVAHGLLLAGERYFLNFHKQEPQTRWNIAGVFRAVLTFSAVSFLWLLFQLKEFVYVLEYLRCLTHNDGGFRLQGLYVIGVFSAPVVFWQLWGALRPVREKWPLGWQRNISLTLYGAMLFLILTNSGPPGDFIYFQF